VLTLIYCSEIILRIKLFYDVYLLVCVRVYVCVRKFDINWLHVS